MMVLVVLLVVTSPIWLLFICSVLGRRYARQRREEFLNSNDTRHSMVDATYSNF